MKKHCATVGGYYSPRGPRFIVFLWKAPAERKPLVTMNPHGRKTLSTFEVWIGCFALVRGRSSNVFKHDSFSRALCACRVSADMKSENRFEGDSLCIKISFKHPIPPGPPQAISPPLLLHHLTYPQHLSPGIPHRIERKILGALHAFWTCEASSSSESTRTCKFYWAAHRHPGIDSASLDNAPAAAAT
jgi:hypothetical protein